MMKRLLILTILFTALIWGALGGLEWYRSSASGIPGTRLNSPGSQLTPGWTLSIEESEERETRTLYLDGIRQSASVFIRANGRLIAREELDSDGEIISRVEYAYDSDGNPRAVYIGLDYVEADTRVSADGNIRRHSAGSGGDWRVTDLNTSGQPVRRVTLESGVVSGESIWTRNDNGTLREEIHSSGDETRRNRFDSDGRLLEETVTRGGSVVLVRTYSWSDGNLTRVEERGEGRTVVREMKWSEDRVVSESRSVDGIIASQIFWKSPEERVETLYRDGEAVIRVIWQDDVRIREEFLRNGEIVRVREGSS
jgi:hypothetical protein